MIFSHVITDDSELFVCGSFWPGFYDGAPAPDWWHNPDPVTGGAPTIDKRTRPATRRERARRNRAQEGTDD